MGFLKSVYIKFRDVHRLLGFVIWYNLNVNCLFCNCFVFIFVKFFSLKLRISAKAETVKNRVTEYKNIRLTKSVPVLCLMISLFSYVCHLKGN